MKTIKLNINCSDETCSVDIYRQCYKLENKGLMTVKCLLFNTELRIKGIVSTNSATYMDYYRCKECKEAEVKGGD